ncbi:hypothetical protein FJTKL_12434 [Diaporthe vaccinii]|uniref:Ras family protein n=1 Tax=Diaporthe vaccinii TaxID=105482 RepID=A0ABR4EDY2_9PEZI
MRAEIRSKISCSCGLMTGRSPFSLGGVGKTCLTEQFFNNGGIKSYDPTIGSHQKQLAVDGRQVILEIDTLGTDQLTSTDVYIKNARGFLLVFSITSRSSLGELNGIREAILGIKRRDQVPMVIIGNKADLEDQRDVPRTKAWAVSQDWDAHYHEASAVTGTNVDEALFDICRQMLSEDDAIDAMDEEMLETKYKYDETSTKRRRRKRNMVNQKCVIL